MKNVLVLIAVFISAMLLVSSCRSAKPKDTLLLSPASELSAMKETGIDVVIRTVRLPGFLNRTSVSRLVGENHVGTIEGVYWAENLESGVRDVLTDNLRAVCGSNSLHEGARIDVSLVFRHFELTDAGQVKVEVIVVAKDGSRVRETRIKYSVPCRGDNEIAERHSDALAELAKKLVEWLCETDKK